MLLDGGADVRLFGFRRAPKPVVEVHGVPAIDLGQTWDARLIARAFTILRERFIAKRYAALMEGVDAIVARNLDVLALGYHARTCAQADVPLIYECLDIHGCMLGEGTKAHLMRGLEAFFLRKTSGLIVSSPAFIREYFNRYQRSHKPYLLVENKYPESSFLATKHNPPPPMPWRIGWFGHLRCEKSLKFLLELAERSEGRVQVIIRGKIIMADKELFHGLVRQSSHVRYEGPYNYNDIPLIYRDIHFCWAIDYYQEGANSSWLLPNRIYEAASQQVVPIALDQVEAGRWLKSRNCGVLINNPVEDLLEFFEHLNPTAYEGMCGRVAAIPKTDVLAGGADNVALVNFILGKHQEVTLPSNIPSR
jgi:succinoglycan biosynthesis protein ExoL